MRERKCGWTDVEVVETRARRREKDCSCTVVWPQLLCGEREREKAGGRVRGCGDDRDTGYTFCLDHVTAGIV